MTAPAREAAYKVLRDVHTGRENLPQAQAEVNKKLSDPRDRALASEIVMGTLRWRATLDTILGQVSTRPLDTLDDEILDLLRASTYQILYLDRVPSHAVINDSVSQARTCGKHSASGFVNAVLRSVSHQAKKFYLPPRPNKTHIPSKDVDIKILLDYLSTTLSHPRWLVKRWLHRYGFEATETWAQFNNKPAPIALRVNTVKTTTNALIDKLGNRGVNVQLGRWSPLTLIVIDGNPLTTPEAKEGLFLIQNEASQLVAQLVQAKPGDKVLDACASPGGKTLAIAGNMSDNGLLVAGDLRKKRLALLLDILSRCSTQCTNTVLFDLKYPPFNSVFNRVLVDTPCSGLGTIRRDPDIRWKLHPEELPILGTMQLELLNAAATVVVPGGQLVYATCSSEPEENQEVIERFLKSHPSFALNREVPLELEPFMDNNWHFQTLPFRDQLEAFFAVSMKRDAI